jgi:hypothetical protein
MSGNDRIEKNAVPESTGTCTSWYTDFRVLPANNMFADGLISLSAGHPAEEDLLRGEKEDQRGLHDFLRKNGHSKAHRVTGKGE